MARWQRAPREGIVSAYLTPYEDTTAQSRRWFFGRSAPQDIIPLVGREPVFTAKRSHSTAQGQRRSRATLGSRLRGRERQNVKNERSTSDHFSGGSFGAA